MTHDELREAVLAALLDYDTLKKTRRLRAVKKALQGTMMATLIGSTGLMAAGQGRNSQEKEIAAMTAANVNAMMSTSAKLLQEASQPEIIPGVAHFSFNRHTLAPVQEERLRELAAQLPKNSEISIIGRTDPLGGHSYNAKLGKKRAQAVASYLESHGFKIKAVESEISNKMPENWMERRVDIILGSVPQPFFLNLNALDKQRAFPQESQTKAEPKLTYKPPVSSHSDYYNNSSKVNPKIDNSPELASTYAGAKSSASTDVAKAKPGQQTMPQRQEVRGVTHFGLNRYTLAAAHKDRLMDLIKQLPKDAELVVIGRTDSHGVEEHNKNLGTQRAKTVALFLGYHGVKIKAVGSKAASAKYAGWGARRVDIVVDSGLTQAPINMPPLVAQKPSSKKKPTHHPEAKPKLDSKRAVAIEKDITRVIERARDVYNMP